MIVLRWPFDYRRAPLRASRGFASLTVSGRPPKSFSFNSAMAVRGIVIRHLDKPKTFAAARIPILDNLSTTDRAKRNKKFLEA